MKKQMALGLATAVCALGASAFAGDGSGAEEREMYCIIKEIVKPALTEQYEAAIKKMISEYKAYQIDPEKVHWKTVSGPEIGYLYVMPMENWASMDTMRANWMDTVETIGEERFKEMMAPATEATEEVHFFHVIRRADLSYAPENPRLAKEDVGYVHYGFYYVLPGKEKEIEALAKEFVELYQSKGIDTGWSIYQSLTGTDLPLIVVAHGAKSEADYHANRARIHELLGEDAEKIGKKVYATIRKSEYKDGYIRPDLSYPGPDTEPAGEARKGHAHEGHSH